MCSINGFTFSDESLIKQMNSTTNHRGPDASGIYADGIVSLGNNRLKIIDLSDNASQPMQSNDGRYVIVYNGELYNFKELRKNLSYSFQTQSDTEVVLSSYIEWGKKCVEKFNGMFAFAIWDKQTKELFLARDHIGIKPLYYYYEDGKLIFSSEIKSILAHDIPRQLDWNSFEHYLRLVYVPEPKTMFKNIYKFPPAHRGTFCNGELKTEKFWETKPGQYNDSSHSEIKAEVRARTQEAVKRQLVSDRPLGVYLSGGIDSSTVLHNVKGLGHEDVDTFSVGFDLGSVAQRKKFNADFHLARKTADFYKTNHHEVFISPDEVPDLFRDLAYHLDEPISNSTGIAMMKLAKFVKDSGVDVVLGGDGGDELFGGYPRYRLSYAASTYQKFSPTPLRRFLARHHNTFDKLNKPAGIERFKLFMFSHDSILREVLTDLAIAGTRTEEFFADKFFSDQSVEHFEDLFMDVDRRTWLVDESLMRSDKTTMAYGLEGRVPLLDRQLVEYAASIPLRYKLSLFNTKKILKEAFREDLPAYLFKQKKRGWIAPAAKWLRYEPVEKFAREVLSPDFYSGTKNLFKWSAIETILDKHISGERYNLRIIWMFLTFQLWAREYSVDIN